MAGHYPWPPNRLNPEPGFNCGWCHQRVPDLGHVAVCRLDKGKTSRENLSTFEAARRQKMIDELQSWVEQPKEEREIERSTFVISLDHLPGGAWETLVDIANYAHQKYGQYGDVTTYIDDSPEPDTSDPRADE